MRIGIALWVLLVALVGFWIWQGGDQEAVPGLQLRQNAGKAPSDWFWRQRAYPFEDIDHEAFLKAQFQFERLRAEPMKRRARWQDLGPTLVGGRMTDVEYFPGGSVLAGSAMIFSLAFRGLIKRTPIGCMPIFKRANSNGWAWWPSTPGPRQQQCTWKFMQPMVVCVTWLALSRCH